MATTEKLSRTVLHDWHVRRGAKMVPFAGYDMPVQYGSILAEHLAVRHRAGLFDISHMGRFLFSGEPVPFLQYVLTNNVNALHEPGMAQYTLIPNEYGGAVDDAYLYRTGESEFMLVVNAANRTRDWEHLACFFLRFPGLVARDASEEIAMLALQGPESERILEGLLGRGANSGTLPENEKNRLARVRIDGVEVIASRTGYTGEPVGFELFVPAGKALSLWAQLLEIGEPHGLVPAGLGARDTLRLEAGYPLYGQELGVGPDGREIPIFALALGRHATRFDPGKGDFVGREALHAQYEEVREALRGRTPPPASPPRGEGSEGGTRTPPPTSPPPGEGGRPTPLPASPPEGERGEGGRVGQRLVPRFVWPVAVLNPEGTGPGQNPPRHGNEVLREGAQVGWITSGSTVPHWRFEGEGLLSDRADDQARRAIGLAYVDADLLPGEFGLPVEVAKQGAPAPIPALLVETNLRAAPPYARPVIHPERPRTAAAPSAHRGEHLVEALVRRAVENSVGRQQLMVDLIPSEQTPSLLVRLLSILDAAGRYAEHNRLEALGKDAPDIFHYQGTRFIKEVEAEVQAFFREYLTCSEVEARPISGQMANHCVFSGMVDYTNRYRQGEPRRLEHVLVNSLRKGGHLSAQAMGALRNQVMHDPHSGRPAVLFFPVREDNPYRIDVEATKELIERYDPRLLVFGKSMVLHPEPVAEIAEFTRDRQAIIMYDMAHVLGLAGPHFQEPFKDGADIVTGSTHKTFFGTQRGIIASNMSEDSELWPLWERIVRAAFPGITSNHHPGTLLGLLGACYEMMEFGDAYQRQVLGNAKAFARALAKEGLAVEGDPKAGYTETHQVLVRVGRGPEVADRLERNNVVVNSQTLPSDASVSAASGIRLGVQEMTRFGMVPGHFEELAGYIAQIVRGKDLAEEISRFRSRFTEMRYCFTGERAERLVGELLGALR